MRNTNKYYIDKYTNRQQEIFKKKKAAMKNLQEYGKNAYFSTEQFK